MYRITGRDGGTYGPATAEELRRWIEQGRIGAQSLVQAEGSNDWKPLVEFPEFAAALKGASTPPGLPGAPAVSTPTRTSRAAITSLVLGVLGPVTCGLSSIAGLVVGLIALAKITKSRGSLAGRGMAIAGICVSAVFVLALPIVAALLLPAMAKAKHKAQEIVCFNNAKQLCLGVIIYANDNNDQLPPAETWSDAISGYVPLGKLQCPAHQDGTFAFNAGLSGVVLANVADPARTVLVFEAVGGQNLSGGLESATPHGHRARNNEVIVGFVDGHVQAVQVGELGSYTWSVPSPDKPSPE